MIELPQADAGLEELACTYLADGPPASLISEDIS